MGLVMKNVMLVCNAGMSTGILAKKIEKASQGLLSVKPMEKQNMKNMQIIMI